MHRSKRRSAARFAGWGLVLLLYGTTLGYAADLIAADGAAAADAAAGKVASQAARTTAAADEAAGTTTTAGESAAVAAPEVPRVHPAAVPAREESPLVTLTLVAAAAGGLSARWLMQTARQPRTAATRAARAIGRRITTPT
jgi:hypothetical protein